jgi:hypothetical protein
MAELAGGEPVFPNEDKCTVIAGRAHAVKIESSGLGYRTYRVGNGFEAGDGGGEMDALGESAGNMVRGEGV